MRRRLPPRPRPSSRDGGARVPLVERSWSAPHDGGRQCKPRLLPPRDRPRTIRANRRTRTGPAVHHRARMSLVPGDSPRPPSGVKLTYDDLVLFPDDGKRHELIDGAHYVTPSPTRKHQRVSFNLSGLLWSYLQQHPVGEAYSAPFDVVFSEFDVVEPTSSSCATIGEPKCSQRPTCEALQTWSSKSARRRPGGATRRSNAVSTSAAPCRNTGSWTRSWTRSRCTG